MNIKKSIFRSTVAVAFACCCFVTFHRAGAAGGNSAEAPVIIQNGFKAWAKNRDASWAFDVWKIGGLLERDNKPANLSRYFRQMDDTLGGYQSYEVIETKRISQNSAVIYLSVNFAHAATFGRFMMYKDDGDWVVQNMDFNARPEAIMPWLAFEGGSYKQ